MSTGRYGFRVLVAGSMIPATLIHHRLSLSTHHRWIAVIICSIAGALLVGAGIAYRNDQAPDRFEFMIHPLHAFHR